MENYSREALARQGKISVYLGVGRQNAIPAKELQRLAGLDRDQLRRAIEAERRRGVPILACQNPLHHGFYLPKRKSDIDKYIRSLLHRAEEIRRTAEAIERGEHNE